MAESTISSTSSGASPTGLGIQTRVIYAANSGRWWAFWLSAANVIASAYSSDGSTWTTGATHTTTETVGFNTGTPTTDGRSLSVAYANISSTDVVHFSLGEATATGPAFGHYHCRATISGTTITYASDVAGSTTTGSGATPIAYEGGTVAITANHKLIDGCNFGFINASSEDCEVGVWPNADTGSAWTAGTMTGTQILSTAGSGASTWVGSLNSGDNTVFLGDNGDGALGGIGWTNLETSIWNGTSWGTVGTALASNLGSDADPNDWGAVVLDSTHVLIVWRNGTTNIQYRIGSISSQTITWNTAAALPTAGLTQPASGTSGFALISDGSNNVWLFVIDSGTGNPVKYSNFNTATSGAWSSGSWGAWTVFESSSATRTYLGISQQTDGSASKNYLVYWTEGSAVKGELFQTTVATTPTGWVATVWPPQSSLPPAQPMPRRPLTDWPTVTPVGYTFPLGAPPSGATNISLSDSGMGADAIAITAQAPLSDSATGSEALSATVSFTLADTGTGADSVVIGIILPTDGGVGAESLALSVTASLSDSATGTETPSITAQVPLSDSGTGSDQLGLTINVPLSDSALGAESLTVTATISLSDSATGTDSLGIKVTLSLTDTGTGSEVMNLTALIPLNDSGTGTDSVTLGGTPVTLTDSATGSETFALVASIPASESGSGADTLSGVSVTFSIPVDSGSGVEQIPVTALLPLPDSAAGADNGFTLNITAPLVELAAGGEAIGTTVTASFQDNGGGGELAAFLVTFALSLDSASGTDTVSVNQQGITPINVADAGIGAEQYYQPIFFLQAFQGASLGPAGVLTGTRTTGFSALTLTSLNMLGPLGTLTATAE